MLNMSIAMRVILVFASVIWTVVMLRKIRQSKLQIEYAIFWIIFGFFLILLALFPETAIWGAKLLGIVSPINLIFLLVIFLLLVKVFFMTIELSSLENKVKELVQKIALDEKGREEKENYQKESDKGKENAD